MFCIPKILKNESNSQRTSITCNWLQGCFVSQRYWKMKAIHNTRNLRKNFTKVVLYPKDTEKWKQFTTTDDFTFPDALLFCIPKILKNESNSQLTRISARNFICCFVSQRYWKMKSSKGKARRFGVAKAIHNYAKSFKSSIKVVLYPKDTEKWNLAKGKQGDSA